MNPRPLTRDDLPDLTALARLSLSHDAVDAALVEEKTFGDPWLCPDASLVIAEERRVLACAPVALFDADPPTAYVKFFAVHPAHRQQGLATRLFAAMETAARAAGAARIRLLDEPANYLTPGIDARYTAAHCFLEARGYHKDGERINLRADLLRHPLDLAPYEARLARSGVVVRRARPEDEAAVMDFLARHFAGWRYEVGNTFRHAPITTFLAWRGAEIVGFSSHEGNNRGRGTFGPMGNAPHARGLGAGAACCLHSLRDLRDMGHRHAVIPWVGPTRFYAKVCGAEIDRVFWTYEKAVE